MAAQILIVEDEPLRRLLAVDLVEDAGFEALEVGDADEAIGILETILEIRIVVTDIDMPGSINGLRLAAVVRDRWPLITIIVVSGKHKPSPEELPDNALFFSKPSDVRKMTQTFREVAA